MYIFSKERNICHVILSDVWKDFITLAAKINLINVKMEDVRAANMSLIQQSKDSRPFHSVKFINRTKKVTAVVK